MRFSKLEVAIVLVIVLLLTSLLLPAIESARRDARRSNIRNNLKHIGIALHSYHDTFGVLPQAVYKDENDHPRHGWLTMLIPYMACGPLYDSIDLDLPWSHERNHSSFSQSYPPYMSPVRPEQSHDDNGYGLSHFAGNVHVVSPNRSFTLDEITDGTEHTLIAGEAFGDFEPWGKPGNVRDPIDGINKSKSGFGTTLRYRPWGFGTGKPDTTCQFVFVDGSVRALSQDIAPVTLRRLALPDDGENMGEPLIE